MLNELANRANMNTAADSAYLWVAAQRGETFDGIDRIRAA
jgi:hypothetical protein